VTFQRPGHRDVVCIQRSAYRYAERIARALGDTVMNVILRLSSFILVCIGVQIVWNGASALPRSVK
jgi:multiple antibiotic resistance protein